MDRDIPKADAALMIEGTTMAAGTTGTVTVEPVVSLVIRVELAADKVRFSICVGFEWCAKFETIGTSTGSKCQLKGI